MLVGSRGHVNFIDSANITWTLTDDGNNDEIEVTASATGLATTPVTAASVTYAGSTNLVADDVEEALDESWLRQGWSKPSAAAFENMPRLGSSFANGSILSSGRLTLVGIYLPIGVSVASITFVSGGTGAGTPTNQWFALYDSALALLRQTTDDTTTAWGANTAKTLNFTSGFTTTYSGLHYVGIMVTATTVPTVYAISSNSTILGLAPALNGPSNTGLTTTAPNPANAPTAASIPPYCYVS